MTIKKPVSSTKRKRKRYIPIPSWQKFNSLRKKIELKPEELKPRLTERQQMMLMRRMGLTEEYSGEDEDEEEEYQQEEPKALKETAVESVIEQNIEEDVPKNINSNEVELDSDEIKLNDNSSLVLRECSSETECAATESDVNSTSHHQEVPIEDVSDKSSAITLSICEVRTSDKTTTVNIPESPIGTDIVTTLTNLNSSNNTLSKVSNDVMRNTRQEKRLIIIKELRSCQGENTRNKYDVIIKEQLHKEKKEFLLAKRKAIEIFDMECGSREGWWRFSYPYSHYSNVKSRSKTFNLSAKQVELLVPGLDEYKQWSNCYRLERNCYRLSLLVESFVRNYVPRIEFILYKICFYDLESVCFQLQSFTNAQEQAFIESIRAFLREEEIKSQIPSEQVSLLPLQDLVEIFNTHQQQQQRQPPTDCCNRVNNNYDCLDNISTKSRVFEALGMLSFRRIYYN